MHTASVPTEQLVSYGFYFLIEFKLDKAILV